MNVDLTNDELMKLVDWHLEQKCRHRDRDEYTDAEHHRKRAEQLYALQTPVQGKTEKP